MTNHLHHGPHAKGSSLHHPQRLADGDPDAPADPAASAQDPGGHDADAPTQAPVTLHVDSSGEAVRQPGAGHAEHAAAYGGDGALPSADAAGINAGATQPAPMTVSDLITIRYSSDVRVDSLQGSPVAWNYLLPQRNVLYYTFDAGDGTPIAATAGEPVTPFNAMQKDAARHILADASALTGISFVEVAAGAQADIAFANANLGGTQSAICNSGYSYSYAADKTLTAVSAYAHVLVDDVAAASYNLVPTPGGAGYEVLLHEIGHALGLGHPFEGSRALPAAQDNTDNTVMSYTDVDGYKSTFQPYDKLALDWIYGGDGLGGQRGYNSAHGVSFAPAPNDAPVATDAFLAGSAGQPAFGIFAATDANGDRLTFTIVADPSHGSVVLGDDGLYAYVPAAGYEGTDSFSFVANDGRALSNVGTIHLAFAAGQEPPNADAGPVEAASAHEAAIPPQADAGATPAYGDTAGAGIVALGYEPVFDPAFQMPAIELVGSG